MDRLTSQQRYAIIPVPAGVGSDGSAAGGGRSDLSEWPRSKFCEVNSEQRISGTATGGMVDTGVLKNPMAKSFIK